MIFSQHLKFLNMVHEMQKRPAFLCQRRRRRLCHIRRSPKGKSKREIKPNTYESGCTSSAHSGKPWSKYPPHVASVLSVLRSGCELDWEKDEKSMWGLDHKFRSIAKLYQDIIECRTDKQFDIFKEHIQYLMRMLRRFMVRRASETLPTWETDDRFTESHQLVHTKWVPKRICR